MPKEISKILDNVFRLTLLCVISAFLLSLVNSYLEPKRIENEQNLRAMDYRQVLPGARNFEKKISGGKKYVKGYGQDKIPAGKIITVYGRDYNGYFEALFGISEDYRILGVKFMNKSESTNLEDNASKEDFFRQFIGTSVHDLVDVNNKNVKKIHGAPVSSKAYINAVRKAIGEAESIDATNQ